MNEHFFYGGIAVMTLTSMIAIIAMVIFKVSKHNLDNKLLQEESESNKESNDDKKIENIKKQIVKHKKNKILTSIFMIILFVLGGFLSYIGIKRIESAQQSMIYSEQSSIELAKGDINEAIDNAIKALPDPDSIFVSDYTSYGQKALTEALGIYNQHKGFDLHEEINQPTEIKEILLSENGNTLALLCDFELILIDTELNQTIEVFTSIENDFRDIKFIGSDYFIYTNIDGVEVYNIEQQETVFTGIETEDIAISGDGNIIATIYKDDEFATIYNLKDEQVTTASFYGKTRNEDNGLFSLNNDGTLLVTSFLDGSIHLNYLNKYHEYIELLEHSDFKAFDGGFYNNYLALLCSNDTNYTFSIIDIANLSKTTGFEIDSKMQIIVEESGVYLSNEKVVVKIDPETGEQQNIAYIGDDDFYIHQFFVSQEYTLIFTENNSYYIFDPEGTILKKNTVDNLQGDMKNNIIVLKNEDDKKVDVLKRDLYDLSVMFTYDTEVKYTEAKISSDGTRLILFGEDEINIYTSENNIVYTVDISIKDAEIIEQNYIRNEIEEYLEVIYSNGYVYSYKPKNGQIIDIYEINLDDYKDDGMRYFYTNDYKIQVSEYGAPIVYKLDSNKIVAQLYDNAYLLDITQLENHILVEYSSLEGEKFAHLLNNNLEIVTELPNFIDTLNNDLIFDNGNGIIRKEKIYSVLELKNMVN